MGSAKTPCGPSAALRIRRVGSVCGEIRLWVQGEEVSGGRGDDPRTGFVCLTARRASGGAEGSSGIDVAG